ncbi:MAG TPA: hypothetical protein PLR06_03600 [Cyclobacteriaceae bacterium]|nr:hypothetical protein [Cyclobacteriaceae bacterium]
MRKVLVIVLCMLTGCTTRKPYSPAEYLKPAEQNEVLTSIIAYIFVAPTYVKMEERFKPDHRPYYSSLTSRFSLEKYFIAEDGTHYFYIIRPGPSESEKRGVGGHFKMGDQYQLSNFREEFVTPLLPEADVKGRCSFLFEEMISNHLDQYLKMETYIQWPNAISYYDTITYEWKLKIELEAVPIN